MIAGADMLSLKAIIGWIALWLIAVVVSFFISYSTHNLAQLIGVGASLVPVYIWAVSHIVASRPTVMLFKLAILCCVLSWFFYLPSETTHAIHFRNGKVQTSWSFALPFTGNHEEIRLEIPISRTIMIPVKNTVIETKMQGKVSIASDTNKLQNMLEKTGSVTQLYKSMETKANEILETAVKARLADWRGEQLVWDTSALTVEAPGHAMIEAAEMGLVWDGKINLIGFRRTTSP